MVAGNVTGSVMVVQSTSAVLSSMVVVSHLSMSILQSCSDLLGLLTRECSVFHQAFKDALHHLSFIVLCSAMAPHL
jgi:hypothetical protein